MLARAKITDQVQVSKKKKEKKKLLYEVRVSKKLSGRTAPLLSIIFFLTLYKRKDDSLTRLLPRPYYIPDGDDLNATGLKKENKHRPGEQKKKRRDAIKPVLHPEHSTDSRHLTYV